MINNLSGTCKQASCNVASDGVCIEGYTDIDQCPDFIRQVLEDTHNSLEQNQESIETVMPHQALEVDDRAGSIYLSNGDFISGNDVNSIMQSALARVIVLAGSSGSGKTTLISQIYEEFQKHPYAGYYYAYSHTLPGFERRCFFSRMSSGRIEAVTEHTTITRQINFLHLRVQSEELKNEPQNLLFADVSGELFSQAQTNSHDAKRLEAFRRADHFVLLLDGAKLIDNRTRQQELLSGTLLLRNLIEQNILMDTSYVDILFSKYDLIHASPHHQRCESFMENAKSSIQNDFQNRLGRIRFFEVAARPATNDIPPSHNLDGIFQSWVKETPLLELAWKNDPLPVVTLDDMLRQGAAIGVKNYD